MRALKLISKEIIKYIC